MARSGGPARKRRAFFVGGVSGDDGINQQAMLVLNYLNDLSIDQFQRQNGTPFTIDPALYW
jgi:hypothetical protein